MSTLTNAAKEAFYLGGCIDDSGTLAEGFHRFVSSPSRTYQLAAISGDPSGTIKEMADEFLREQSGFIFFGECMGEDALALESDEASAIVDYLQYA